MSTLILLSLPPSSFCAIDLASFTTTPQFSGIKSIPPGLHTLYFSSSSPPIHPSDINTHPDAPRISELPQPSASAAEDSGLTLRTSFFFTTSPSTPVIIRKWSPATESFLKEEDISAEEVAGVKARLKEIYQNNLSPYEKLMIPEEKLVIWNNVTSNINTPSGRKTLTRVLGKEWGCESSQEAGWEREELEVAIRAQREKLGGAGAATSGSSREELSEATERILNFTKIDMKRSWPPNAVGRERTIWARDRSWLLTNTFATLSSRYSPTDEQQTGGAANMNSTAQSLSLSLPGAEDTKEGQESVLAEICIAFILCVLLGNFTSSTTFKSLLEVALTSEEAVGSHAVFYGKLLKTIGDMLRMVRLVGGEKDVSDDDDDEEVAREGRGDLVLEEFVVGGDRWLVALLKAFGGLVEDMDAEEGKVVKERFAELRKYVRRFGWDLGGEEDIGVREREGEDEYSEEEGEFAPVVVGEDGRY